MVFQLTEEEIQNAYEAIEHHGYSGLAPHPLEWEIVKDNWPEVKTEISSIDLDTYRPLKPLLLFSPKSRATIRPVYLLHPIDLIIYSALTLIIKNDIEKERIPKRKKRVFSYRVDQNSDNRFYSPTPTFIDYRAEAKRKAERTTTKFFAIADIADFFPRIYQHRLENVIEAFSSNHRNREVARVLVKKFIDNLLGKNSYGIPIGPFASRVLSEGVLIDIDSGLLSEGADFVRWVDDYIIFCKSESEAQNILFHLAEKLYTNHGLSLSAVKTKILSKEEFLKIYFRDPEEEVANSYKMLIEWNFRFDPYSNEEIDLSEEEIIELESINFRELIEGALENHQLVDYEKIQVILRHPSLLKKLTDRSRWEIADVLLNNIEHLYPISEDVSKFFQTFSNSSKIIRNKISKKLLRSIRSSRGKWPPEYHIIWILSVFTANSGWLGAGEILKIFQTHPSDAVRRYAALALYRNGSRSEAVEIKNRYESSSPLTRTAILLASRNLGADERKHWRRTIDLNGILESKI